MNIKLFPTFLTIHEYDRHDELVSIHDTICSNHLVGGKAGEAISGNSLHHEKSLSPFYTWVSEMAIDYLMQLNMNMSKFDLLLAKSWLSYVKSDIGTVPPHSHADHHLSFIYYVRAPPDSDMLSFGLPFNESINEPFYEAFNYRYNNINDFNELNSTSWSFDVAPSQLWIFPSKLRHWTKRVKSDFTGVRQAIAGDFKLVYNDVNNKTPFGMYYESHSRKFV